MLTVRRSVAEGLIQEEQNPRLQARIPRVVPGNFLLAQLAFLAVCKRRGVEVPFGCVVLLFKRQGFAQQMAPGPLFVYRRRFGASFVFSCFAAATTMAGWQQHSDFITSQ